MSIPDITDQPADHIALLRGTSLFGDLDAASLQKLNAELEGLRLNGGETLMYEGEVGDGLFVLLSGRLRAFVKGPDGTERLVGEIGRGETVGEMAVLGGTARSATVRAVRDSELVKLRTTKFEELVRVHPEVLMRLTRALVRRLTNTTHAVHQRQTMVSVAVVPAGAGDAPVAEAARRIARALTSIGSTLHLTSASVDKAIGDGDGIAVENTDEAMALTRWVDVQELRYRFVVYEADATPNLWTKCCIRQADHVLAIGAANANPALSAVEAWMSDPENAVHAVRELVLAHDAGSTPHNTAAWLTGRDIVAHHHVRIGNHEDFERVARLITGRGVGLVLSGGGARGYAHIGVIKAMQERDIPIDVIGGTSMGAIIAAQYAQGMSPDEMVEQCRHTFVAWTPHRSPTLPVVSMINNSKLNRVLRAVAGHRHIEDLWLRYFSVASNLTRAVVEEQTKGSLYEAIRSSCSVPGLGPPLIRNGELIVDGGILNNLPIDVARRMTHGKVIASNVAAREDLSSSLTNADDLSGWMVLFSWLNPFMKSIRIPTFGAIIERTAMLAGVLASDAVSKDADLYLQPPAERYGATEWAPLDTMVEIGYRHAMSRLDEWEAQGGTPIRHTDTMPTYISA